MKYTFWILCLLTLVGCTPKKVNLPSQPVPPVEAQPEMPSERPPTPKLPSDAYLKGYRDGYYGTWLAPGRWLVKDDYRNGWSAGNYDRNHHLPNRFDPVK